MRRRNQPSATAQTQWDFVSTIVRLVVVLTGIITMCEAWISSSNFGHSTTIYVSPRCPFRGQGKLVRRLASDDESIVDESATSDTTPKPEWGVSYIGGDPCGSKYNDDPFDTQVQKPGMPDDMKARIQALVDQKVAEEKAQQE